MQFKFLRMPIRAEYTVQDFPEVQELRLTQIFAIIKININAMFGVDFSYIYLKGLYKRGKKDAMKDSEIVELYWKRDESAIAATAESYGNYCYSIAYRILQRNEDAQECVNDTYWKAWLSIPPQRPNRLAAYLGKITRNLSLDRIKRLNAQKRGSGHVELVLQELENCIPATTDLDQIADELVLVGAINQFLRGQSRIERNIFVGRYWHLYSISDLAQAHGMHESKVASLLFRMRQKLKCHLEKEGISI